MNTQVDFKVMLTTANFSTQARNEIVEFCCNNLAELANLLDDDLDTGIMNLHKLLSNTTVAVRRVRLNETKYIILHFIRINFKDHIDYNEPLATVAIAVLILTDVHTMRDDYL